MITSLMRIRQSHNLTSRQIAEQAGLSLQAEYTAEIGGPVEKDDAAKIANALSALAGKSYAVEALGLTLKKSGEARANGAEANAPR